MNRLVTWEDCTNPEGPRDKETPDNLFNEFWRLNNSDLPPREITQDEHNLAWQKAWEHFQTLGLPSPNGHFSPVVKYVRGDQLLCTFAVNTQNHPTIYVFGPPSGLKTIHRLNAA